MTAVISALLFLGLVYSQAGATSAAPVIRLNGMDDMVIHTQTDTLTVSVQLDAGDQIGEQAEWWIVANTPSGWYYYQYADIWNFGGDGLEDLMPAYQGAIFNLTEPLELLRLTGLAAGTYVFYFGVDTSVNGLVDTGSLSYDRDSFEVVEARSFSVVDTGQDICYDDSGAIPCPESGESFYGQDAQHTGNAPRYTNNGNGTITDKVTGLMWQKSPDTDGDGDIDANDKLTYDEAVAGAGMLGLGGYKDWRLPTIKELYSLIEFSGIDHSGYEGTDTSGLTPFIDTVYFDFAYGDTSAGERIIDAQYASATKYVSTTMNGNETMFGVNFADGRIKGYPTEHKSFFVLYVRGNTGYGQNDFTDNGDGTISDNATGLMWAQNDSAVGLNWKGALAWVQMKNLENYLGYNDWRLPTAKELQSIVDYSRSPDTTGSAAIDPLFNATSIINEAGQTDYPFYWSSTTHANWSAVSGGFSAYLAFGRALGYMNGSWKDVHGAGAQRSDPKAGDPDDYPTGHGPQGDAIRIYNYVRLVRDKDLVANFIGDSTRVEAQETVNFTDLSTGNPTSWSWKFEEGTPSTSTDQNPKITYSTSGSYPVTLMVTNAVGSYSVTKTDYITVFATSGVFGGYMLLAPLRSNITYLIDTDESVAHTWTSDYTPGNSAYLLEDGTLLRTGKISNGNRFADTGGVGGVVERFDWDGSVNWSYSLATDEECLHHDVEFLPNGNILMIAWEHKTSGEAVAAGRDFSLLADGELWPDKIIEVDPSTNNIVWEWHVWDHLIQDYDIAKSNYGTIDEHPELIDLNYVGSSRGVADWNHTNSIDYNEDFDQIILSVHGFDEFWVIDHSTTTAEAASHYGGTYGKGGDILYRWGNPETYGVLGDHVFYGQHDAQWISSGSPGSGNILVFNNGQNRPQGNYSTVEEIVPDVNPDGSYPLTIGQASGPLSQEWIYMAPNHTDFYAQNISGAQRLPNGNTLICEGANGYVFEVTNDGTVVWTYQDTGAIFKVIKYPYDYSGLSDL